MTTKTKQNKHLEVAKAVNVQNGLKTYLAHMPEHGWHMVSPTRGIMNGSLAYDTNFYMRS
jgi:hypothetical protein